MQAQPCTQVLNYPPDQNISNAALQKLQTQLLLQNAAKNSQDLGAKLLT